MALSAQRSFHIGLLVCGFAGLGNALVGYYRRSAEDAIMAAAVWFIAGPLIAYWRYREELVKPK